MGLYIHGIGALARGVDEPFAEGTGRLEEVPIANYTRPAFRRRFGRLAKLVYVAAARAIADAGVEDPSELAIVGSSALGETTVSLDLLAQIKKSMGRTLRPWLVPNSVHNAPAGYLTIGHQSHRPSVTVSQGWLSAEAALVAAEDLLASGAADRALVFSGDEADPAWVERLRQMGATAWADRMEKEAFQEAAVAIVVGIDPGGRELGSITAAVENQTPTTDGIAALLTRYDISPSKAAEIRVRIGAGGPELKDITGPALGRSEDEIHCDGPGPGTSQAGAFISLLDCIQAGAAEELLLLSKELDELAFVHWSR